MEVVTLGIDLAKNVFQLHGVDAIGHVVLKKKVSRGQLIAVLSKIAPCLVGLEACGSAHYWAREISGLGHDVKLMPAQYVRPYVKRNKTDAADAAAICEAVTRPDMRFVAVKSADQQAVLLHHRSRDLLVKQRTMLANALRAHMAEFGVIAPQGLRNVEKLKAFALDRNNALPASALDVLKLVFSQMEALSAAISELEKKIALWHKGSTASQRLATIPGIGPLTASAIVASIGDGQMFSSGRSFASWLGLTPREHSSGGKQRLSGITKRGDGYIRRMMVHGARAVVRMHARKNARANPWLDGMLMRKHKNTATVAVANKNARMAWAILRNEGQYQEGYDAHKAA